MQRFGKWLLFILFMSPLSWSLLFCNDDHQKLKVGFVLKYFTVRGTGVALFDYADFNEKILNNESIIIVVKEPPPKWILMHPDFPCTAEDIFKKRFQGKFFECNSLTEMDQILLKEHVDVLYILKSGQKDALMSAVVPNAVHAVFPPLQPHGEIYATISKWLSAQGYGGKIPYVPHIVRLDATRETLHDELGIPKGAIVFGRHGGFDSFDIVFAQEVVVRVATDHPDWYFLFLNTQQFCHLPNVIFLPATPDLEYKTRFINTCDAMIHARRLGESFGLACAEFSIQNKPVITWSGATNPSYQRNHIEVLGDKGFYYNDRKELIDILTSMGSNIESVRQSNWDVYSDTYNPDQVMQQFDKVFLEPIKAKKRASLGIYTQRT